MTLSALRDIRPFDNIVGLWAFARLPEWRSTKPPILTIMSGCFPDRGHRSMKYVRSWCLLTLIYPTAGM
jgi:hypothetical protein